MRHRKSGRQLNRNSSHRRAMFRNMAGSLVRHEIIKTTLPKAKELRRVVEPLITLAKTDSVANRRLAFARTRDNEIVAKLFNELGPRFASRAGGYTRILKCGFRAGDNAPMAYIELVDRSEKAEAAARVICSNVKKPASAGFFISAESPLIYNVCIFSAHPTEFIMWLLDQWAERHICDAQNKGEFENLPGSGEPLILDDDSHIPPELRAGYRLLKNAGCLPPELQQRNEAVELADLLKGIHKNDPRYSKSVVGWRSSS